MIERNDEISYRKHLLKISWLLEWYQKMNSFQNSLDLRAWWLMHAARRFESFTKIEEQLRMLRPISEKRWKIMIATKIEIRKWNYRLENRETLCRRLWKQNLKTGEDTNGDEKRIG